MALLFSNNASAELAAALTADATTLYVEEGKGSYFPVISTEGDYFYVTLVGDSVMEIVKVTSTEGDTFTIVRAQDNTEAAAFAIGDLIELRITAAAFKDINTSFSTLDNKINVDITNSINTLDTKLSNDITTLSNNTNTSITNLNTTLTNSINNVNSTLTTNINNVNTTLTNNINSVSTAATTGINEAKAAATAAQNTANTALTSMPVGTVIAFAANSTPSGGYILCNGAAVSRTTYSALFAAISTTYGAGNGSTTFNLPNLTDRFIQGSGTAGTTKAAGVPNIYGHIAQRDDVGLRDSWVNATGAFWGEGTSNNRWRGTEGGYGATYAAFDASRVSSVYGSSTTVQPPAVTMRYYIKY